MGAIRRNTRVNVGGLRPGQGPGAPSHQARAGLVPLQAPAGTTAPQEGGDKDKRLWFCHWLLGKWKLLSFRKGLIMTDVVHFHLDGSVVKQNSQFGGPSIPTRRGSERGTPHTRQCSAEWPRGV